MFALEYRSIGVKGVGAFMQWLKNIATEYGPIAVRSSSSNALLGFPL